MKLIFGSALRALRFMLPKVWGASHCLSFLCAKKEGVSSFGGRAFCVDWRNAYVTNSGYRPHFLL
jgi:hypothetical protein